MAGEGRAEVEALETLGLRAESILALAILSIRRRDQEIGVTISKLVSEDIARRRAAKRRVEKRTRKSVRKAKR